MILTTAATDTERLTTEHAATLKACDRIRTFRESGWFFAFGWKGEKLVLKTHADDEAQYNSLMGFGNPWGSLNAGGDKSAYRFAPAAPRSFPASGRSGAARWKPRVSA
jgi:hypothetical protein